MMASVMRTTGGVPRRASGPPWVFPAETAGKAVGMCTSSPLVQLGHELAAELRDPPQSHHTVMIPAAATRVFG